MVMDILISEMLLFVVVQSFNKTCFGSLGFGRDRSEKKKSWGAANGEFAFYRFLFSSKRQSFCFLSSKKPQFAKPSKLTVVGWLEFSREFPRGFFISWAGDSLDFEARPQQCGLIWCQFQFGLPGFGQPNSEREAWLFEQLVTLNREESLQIS